MNKDQVFNIEAQLFTARVGTRPINKFIFDQIRVICDLSGIDIFGYVVLSSKCWLLGALNGELRKVLCCDFDDGLADIEFWSDDVQWFGANTYTFFMNMIHGIYPQIYLED